MGTTPYKSDEEIAQMIRSGMSMTEIQRAATKGASIGSHTSSRVKRVANEIGVAIHRAAHSRHTTEEHQAERALSEHMLSEHGRKAISVTNGVVLIGSDSHYWPGIVSTAHRAFVKFCADLRPSAVIKNGDAFDGSTISRWPRIGWDNRPTVTEELKAVDERMTEIEEAARTKNLYWPLGNHDARFETYLAAHAPEYEGVKGFHLKDHFPMWQPCWGVWINNDTVVKHRFKTGIHAPHNNTLWAGRTIVTGHLHSLKVMPISDYNGTRFGVDCGTMAQPYGPQSADYTELNPVNWRSGFVVLTYWKGTLLWPEVCHVVDEEKGLVQFRGAVMKV